jgi:hypothetical protein
VSIVVYYNERVALRRYQMSAMELLLRMLRRRCSIVESVLPHMTEQICQYMFLMLRHSSNELRCTVGTEANNRQRKRRSGRLCQHTHSLQQRFSNIWIKTSAIPMLYALQQSRFVAIYLARSIVTARAWASSAASSAEDLTEYIWHFHLMLCCFLHLAI